MASPRSLGLSALVVAFGIGTALLELGGDLGFDFPEFGDVGVEIAPLAFEIGDVKPAAAQQLAQLLQAGAVDLVEVEQLLDLGEREAEPLAAQDPAEPHPVVRAVEPRQSLAARLDQPLVLVEADGARGDGELAGQLGDAVYARRIARRAFGWNGRGGDGHDVNVIVDVYVNVNEGFIRPSGSLRLGRRSRWGRLFSRLIEVQVEQGQPSELPGLHHLKQFLVRDRGARRVPLDPSGSLARHGVPSLWHGIVQRRSERLCLAPSWRTSLGIARDPFPELERNGRLAVTHVILSLGRRGLTTRLVFAATHGGDAGLEPFAEDAACSASRSGRPLKLRIDCRCRYSSSSSSVLARSASLSPGSSRNLFRFTA